MKKINLLSYFLMAVLCVGFVSCSDDDEDYNVDDLVGKWSLVKLEGWYYENGVKITLDGTVEDLLIMEFKADLTGVATEEGEEEEEEINTPFMWKINGNILSTKEEGASRYENVKITKLTATTLVVEQSGENEDGKYWSKMTFNKLN